MVHITGAGLLKRGVSPAERFTDTLSENEGYSLVIIIKVGIIKDILGRSE